MTKQAPYTESVPLEIIQPLLQQHLDDSTALVTAFDTELMTHAGCGGNLLWRANIAWQSGGEATVTAMRVESMGG